MDMIMGLPLFLLFAIYGVVNAYLPILLSNLGYSATVIGFLQGIFDASGLLFPIFISAKVDRKGNYGAAMVLMGLLMLAVLPVLVLLRNVWITAAVLALFAIGFKGEVPVADALVSRILGDNRTNYGRVRVLGSVGFVCITLLLQFTRLVDPTNPVSIAMWIAIPTVLFTLSVILMPGLLKRRPPSAAAVPATPAPATLSPVPAGEAPSGTISAPRPGSLSRGLAKIRAFPASFWIGIALIFLAFFGMTPSQRFFSLYVQQYLHLQSYSGLWALSAAAEVPFMFLSGWFIRKYGTEKIIVVSLLAIMVRNLVYAAFPTFGGAVAGQLFHSICFGLFHPAAVVFVVERAPKHLVAIGMTLYTSVSVGIASVLGNVAGGIIIDTFGYRMLFVVFSVFPLIGVALFAALRKPLSRRPAQEA
jgi:PPP family 3-phenylpropionic acid transporter